MIVEVQRGAAQTSDCLSGPPVHATDTSTAWQYTLTGTLTRHGKRGCSDRSEACETPLGEGGISACFRVRAIRGDVIRGALADTLSYRALEMVYRNTDESPELVSLLQSPTFGLMPLRARTPSRTRGDS